MYLCMYLCIYLCTYLCNIILVLRIGDLTPPPQKKLISQKEILGQKKFSGASHCVIHPTPPPLSPKVY